MRIALLAVLLCACARAPVVSKLDLHSADPAVYRAVLDSMSASHGRHRPTQLVLIDSTFTGQLPYLDLSGLSGIDSAAVADFHRRNRESRSLKYLGSAALTVPIVLVSRKTLESFLRGDPEQYWAEFYRRYPGSRGSIGFSSIGYSADGNVAILEVDQGCGSLCGASSNVVVKRERGRWRVVLVQITVVS